jgi:hypothetical protein
MQALWRRSNDRGKTVLIDEAVQSLERSLAETVGQIHGMQTPLPLHTLTERIGSAVS